MASINHLLIFGALLTFSYLVVAPLPPGYEISESFGECQKVSDDLSEPMVECLKQQFTPEQVNETRELYSGSACLPCRHICRKQEEIKGCLRLGVDILKDVSNKSKTMVPFSAQLVETTLKAMCENEEEIFPVITEEESNCFRNGRNACASKAMFIRYMDAVVYCDSGNPETDPLTKEYVCKEMDGYLDCLKENIIPCAGSLENTFTVLKTKLATSEPCSPYY
ncbi:uncharacterized protein LOC124154399 [Ischnura elegans]|uniref:uncharacterized protein LOC124154399 n=1 Tax=Ischnura elegans TaxID=197161 RepID=UPI001ED8A6E8|nr:uncharacterized protein LOC124154399 [Ischnura elegans]